MSSKPPTTAKVKNFRSHRVSSPIQFLPSTSPFVALVVIQTILELGNQVLGNLGVEEPIEDVGVFFSDQFYIQFFENAFPDIDFSSLEEAQTEEDMAANIQALLDLLSDEILNYDLSHIRGSEIVQGNPEHCINLLQLANEIALMIQGGDRATSEPDHENSH